MDPIPEKKKRGRKAKNTSTTIPSTDSEPIIKCPKKRGRKPKGGKIILQPQQILPTENSKINIILHLKCSINDIKTNNNNNILSKSSESENSNMESLQFSDNKSKYSACFSCE